MAIIQHQNFGIEGGIRWFMCVDQFDVYEVFVFVLNWKSVMMLSFMWLSINQCLYESDMHGNYILVGVHEGVSLSF